jgi:hypothetical protein
MQWVDAAFCHMVAAEPDHGLPARCQLGTAWHVREGTVWLEWSPAQAPLLLENSKSGLFPG